MAEKTSIAWCDATFNPWIGCTKISPGCDHCYAEVSTPARTFKVRWEAGAPRHHTSSGYWREPLLWNRKQSGLLNSWEWGVKNTEGEAELSLRGFIKPKPMRVFAGSLCDFADNEVPAAWIQEFSDLVEATPSLSWLLCTKRIGNVPKLYPRWAEEGFPANVRILVSITSDLEARRDIPKLLALDCKNGVSYEPALARVDWNHFLSMDQRYVLARRHAGGAYHPRRLEWLIVGGESRQVSGSPRPFNIHWIPVAETRESGTALFVKQFGAYPIRSDDTRDRLSMRDRRAGANIEEFPDELRVREFPE